ncbi:hypothetical protein J2W58_004941 [Pseudomonas psychrotolerans]|nr:hypothetical protein [Pseudomonas psychrotolerans]
MDLLAWLQWRLLRLPSLDYRLLARWLAGLSQGRFRYEQPTALPSVRRELPAGWLLHYLIGIAWAGLLVLATGPAWLANPTLGPALLAGLISLGAPLLLLQPAFGLGLAGRRTPNPWRLRLRSGLAHIVFGLGLYGAARVLSLAPWPPH